MVANRRLGDRRNEMRFEIVGDLWATLTTAQPLPLVNLGPGGLLVESHDPLVVGSAQRLRLRLRNEMTEVGATVKHVRPAPGRPDRYLVGLAFLELTETARRVIDVALGEQGSGSIGDGEA